MVAYFFDTYAMIELVKTSPAYAVFIEEPVTTTKFNLAELFYILLSEVGEEKAMSALTKFKDFEAEVTGEILIKAMKFRLQHKRKGFSYADCIGYVFAVQNRMKFLTGDDAFRGMDNVEFVK